MMDKTICKTGWESLGFKSYKDFLSSKFWNDKREIIISCHPYCSNCGTKENLCVHHLTYETLGNESMKDVEVLCFKCHSKIHEKRDKDGGCY